MIDRAYFITIVDRNHNRGFITIVSLDDDIKHWQVYINVYKTYSDKFIYTFDPMLKGIHIHKSFKERCNYEGGITTIG